MHFEIDHNTNYRNGFRNDNDWGYATPYRLVVPKRWLLVTAYYDFDATDWWNAGTLLINDGVAAEDIANRNQVHGSGQPSHPRLPPLTPPSDITMDDSRGPHKLTFSGTRQGHDYKATGSWASSNVTWSNAPNATLDEIVIYDFGRYPLSAGLLAGRRFDEGRYYKGAAYTRLNDLYVADQAGAFFTAPLTLPVGSRLQKVAWTWYRPRELPDDYAEIELTEPSGSAYLGEPGPNGSAATRSTRSIGWTAQRQEWAPDRRLPGAFRAHVVFRRKDGSATVDPDTPILDSPVFDDLSFHYRPGCASPFSGWSEGE